MTQECHWLCWKKPKAALCVWFMTFFSHFTNRLTEGRSCIRRTDDRRTKQTNEHAKSISPLCRTVWRTSPHDTTTNRSESAFCARSSCSKVFRSEGLSVLLEKQFYAQVGAAASRSPYEKNAAHSWNCRFDSQLPNACSASERSTTGICRVCTWTVVIAYRVRKVTSQFLVCNTLVTPGYACSASTNIELKKSSFRTKFQWERELHANINTQKFRAVQQSPQRWEIATLWQQCDKAYWTNCH